MLDVEHWKAVDRCGLGASPVVRQHEWNPPMYALLAIGKMAANLKKGRFLCGEIAIFRIRD
jgi:hypothetical protein